MLTKIIVCATLGLVATCGVARAEPCPAAVDRSQLTLSYADFDAAGWRDLVGACTDAAVAQLTAYRDANASSMTLDQRLEINFHIGQTLAFGRRDAESVPYFERARDAGATEEWSAYVDATLAFLHHDAAALAATRARYANAAGASAMRIAIIDGMIQCADRPYVEAVHCGMGAMN